MVPVCSTIVSIECSEEERGCKERLSLCCCHVVAMEAWKYSLNMTSSETMMCLEPGL